MSKAGIMWRRPIVFLAIVFCLLFAAGCNRQKPALAVGDKAPDFSAADIDGNRIALADLAGKPVVIRFFLPDCKYCRADTAVFNRFYEMYQQAGLTIIYINTAPKPDKVREFAAELGIRFPVVLDADGKLAGLYRVKAVPQAIVLSPEHKIMAAMLGGVSEAELLELLGPYLNKDGAASAAGAGKTDTATPAGPSSSLPEDERCPVCGMFVARYQNWVVRMRQGNKTLHFDGMKDMMAYFLDPRQFGGAAVDPASEIMVKDYYSLEWVDARAAFYVLGSDVYGPMGHEFIPFASREAAASFLADHNGRQILAFAEITPELVESMRHGQTMK